MTDQSIIDIIKANGYTVEDKKLGRETLAKIIGVSPSKARRILNRLRGGKASETSGAAPKAEDVRTETKNRLDIGKKVYSTPTSLEDVIKLCNVDESLWEVEKWTFKAYEIVTIPRAIGSDKLGWSRESTEPQRNPVGYIAVSFIRKKQVVQNVKKEIDAIVADAKTRIDRLPLIIRTAQMPKNPVMVEINFSDHHFNKLAWRGDTGGANWDLKIAEAVYKEAAENILSKIRGYDIIKFLYVLGNDRLHTDTLSGTTTKGTKVDSDTRYHKAFRVACESASRVADSLRLIAPVDIIVVPGNHDKLGSWTMGYSLSLLYHNQPDVRVICDPLERQYYQWGKVMLGFSHGETLKPEQHAKLMPVEAPRMWADTQWHEIHLGHLHHHKFMEDEFNGVLVRRLSSLTPADHFHAVHGYINNLRKSEAFIWSHYGLEGTATHYDFRDYE